MALLERVSTLIRANLNDLIDKAEHPETMIKQIILDMENQLLQVKTQVGNCHRRPASAGEEAQGKRGKDSRLEPPGRDGGGKSRTIWRGRPLSAPCITSSCARILPSRRRTRSFRWRR